MSWRPLHERRRRCEAQATRAHTHTCAQVELDECVRVVCVRLGVVREVASHLLADAQCWICLSPLAPLRRRLVAASSISRFTLLVEQKALKSLVDLLRDDGSKYLHALDETSRSLSRGGAASASAADTDVDWCTVLMLALTCVQAEKGTKARTPGPVIELWQLIQFLFESAERSGHFLSKPIIDACMQEVITILHLDAAASSGSSSAASAEAKDPLKIQGSIAALSSILDRIFSFAPYTADLPSEYFHDLFALFSNTLTTMSKLTTSELQMPNAAILALIKPHSHFPDSFLGLYQAPAAAVAILAHMMQQYPFTTASANSTASAAARKFLSAHVFPFFLSLFTLRIPDNLLTKLLSGLNSLLDNHVASHLALFRDFAYKFIYAMMQPGAWPKSTTVKQQLVRFVNIVMRLARQLPFNNTLRIVEGRFRRRDRVARGVNTCCGTLILICSVICPPFVSVRARHRPSSLSPPLPRVGQRPAVHPRRRAAGSRRSASTRRVDARIPVPMLARRLSGAAAARADAREQ